MMESRKLTLSRRRNGEQYEDAGDRAYRRTVHDMHEFMTEAAFGYCSKFFAHVFREENLACMEY